jgi:hypothetical protein
MVTAKTPSGVSIRRRYWITALIVIVVAGAVTYWVVRPPERVNQLTADGSTAVSVMDFSMPMAFDPPPAGWFHRTFWTRRAASFSLAQTGGKAALRVGTDNSASMLVRFVDIDLAEYPLLSWRWLIEKPINSAVDERTDEGDDHPARLFIAFRNAAGERRALEIIWGNRILKRGDVKFRGSFPHYVANGGNENVGRWHDEQVDLLGLFKRFWPNDSPGRVTDVAVFCDSDETGTSSVSYFADIRLRRTSPAH